MQGTNCYALILAGGIGQRMGNIEKPKQFIELKGKPILIHTIEKFYLNPKFQQILVLTPKQWMNHTENLLKKYIPDGGEKLVVLEGGATRNDTLMNGISYIEETGGMDEETIVVTHDAVRPFVTTRIIEENIQAAREADACDTVIPATDTIVTSTDGKIISEIPNRSIMYQGQTPQSFKAKMLQNLYNSLNQEEKEILTDAAKICVIKGKSVKLVEGEVYNIKITYPYDVDVAKSLLKEE